MKGKPTRLNIVDEIGSVYFIVGRKENMVWPLIGVIGKAGVSTHGREPGVPQRHCQK
jgi:hypothetical protein